MKEKQFKKKKNHLPHHAQLRTHPSVQLRTLEREMITITDGGPKK